MHGMRRLIHLNTPNKKRLMKVKIDVLTWGKWSIFYHSWSWTNVSQQSVHVSIHTILIKSFEVFTITVQRKKKYFWYHFWDQMISKLIVVWLSLPAKKIFNLHIYQLHSNHMVSSPLFITFYYFFLKWFLNGWVPMTLT